MSSSTAGRYRDERAHALRARFLARFGGSEIPVPVASIAEDLLGLSIHESEHMECSGMLLPARREIWVKASERAYEHRDRFTVAHELGHWLCHVLGGRTEPVFCRDADVRPDDGGRALEREANVFAAELLMPEAAVRTRWAEIGDPSELARRFAVSELAMRWRLYSFALLDEAPARTEAT